MQRGDVAKMPLSCCSSDLVGAPRFPCSEGQCLLQYDDCPPPHLLRWLPLQPLRTCRQVGSTLLVFTIATILNPWFYLCLKFTPRVRNSTRKILPRLPRTSATRAKKRAYIIRSHSLSFSRPSSGGGGSSDMRGVHLNVDLNLIFVATERKLVPEAVRLSLKSRALYMWRISNNFFTEKSNIEAPGSLIDSIVNIVKSS